MMALKFRALAGQSVPWLVVKAVVSVLVVALAALVSREGLALAIIIVFMGVTGPAIRLVTIKMSRIYDRLIVSPVPKPRFFLEFCGLWGIAVLLPLVPAIAVVMALTGPAAMIPVITGTALAVTLGTMAGFLSRGLSDAHLAALLVAGLLIALTLVKTPVAGLIPYVSLLAGTYDPVALVVSVVLPVAAAAVLVLVVSRS
jgi:hypothetical protein